MVQRGTDWQEQMWAEVLAVPQVLPPRGGQVLVVAHSIVRAPWPPEILVEQVCWGEKLQGVFSRVIVEGCGDYGWAELLRQLDDVLVAEGRLVLVVPRPWPLGVCGSRWGSGPSLRQWQGWVAEAGFEVEATTTVAGRWWLLGLGAVRVLVVRRVARLMPIMDERAAVAGV